MIRLFEFISANAYAPAKHKLFRFPAGESHIQLVEPKERQIAFMTGCDPGELFDIAMWADVCGRKGLLTTLILPYLPGARADIIGEGLDACGANVYGGFLNEMVLDCMVCLDPHSKVMPQYVGSLSAVEAADIIPPHLIEDYDGVIAPDKGAVRRAKLVAERFNKPLYQAEKHRDFTTGKLSGFSCEPLPDGKRFVVVDDICDGGGTFTGLAAHLNLNPAQLGLWVSHGVFSKGLTELSKYFGEIGCTDSHPGSTLAQSVVPTFKHLLRSVHSAIQSA
jgi:ribose-phosphate pyrophosphokinase